MLILKSLKSNGASYVPSPRNSGAFDPSALRPKIYHIPSHENRTWCSGFKPTLWYQFFSKLTNR